MKKRFLSLTLLFLFILGMAVPASAREEASSSSLHDVREIINLGEPSDLLPASGPITSDQTQDLSRIIIQPDPDLNLYVTQVAACPIISYVDDNGDEQWGRLLSVKRYATFPANKTQFAALELTSAQLQAVESEIANWVASSPIAGKRWYIVGWYVGTQIAYSANRPKYVDFWSTATNTASGGQDRRTITKTSGTEKFFRDILIPNGLYDSYYNVGISGNFYFTRTSTGQEGGFAFSGNLTVNSDKNPHQ